MSDFTDAVERKALTDRTNEALTVAQVANEMMDAQDAEIALLKSQVAELLSRISEAEARVQASETKLQAIESKEVVVDPSVGR